jgi:Asp-tRNA(Asn)/Glu-tRNA(Gln) amidotransferase A subunit family amidase
MLVKDNIAINDKMNNSAGSFALLGAKVPQDSTVVSKLKAAGVIILGKSSMSEWANFRSGAGNACNGWSAHGGQVLGAYTADQDPSGSSSGSAVGASLGLAFAALGTETSARIIFPGSVNNAVGIKPTVGLTSRSLVIPVSERQDTVGPLARTVTDAAHVLNIIAGKDPSDSYTNAQPFPQPPDYTYRLDALVMPSMYAPGVPALAGLPIVTVPMGKYPLGTQVQRLGPCGLVAVAPNVPIGLSFLGAAWSEEALIGCAFAYEQRTLVREKVRPIVAPTSQLKNVVDY